MPKSKRDKKVFLTKTKKKGIALKEKTLTDIRECCDKYKYIYTFTIENMRNAHLKDVRHEWKSSRFFFGKNKVMSIALGRTTAEEYQDNLHCISAQLKGQTGLLFTHKSRDKVLRYFDEFRLPEFARSGNIAVQMVTLKEGPLSDFPHSMEPQLRKLGLPTQLKRGVVTLLRDFTVCNQGDVLTPEQCQIMKLCGHKMVDFHVTIDCMWKKEDGSFEQFQERPELIKPTKVEAQLRYKDKDEDDNADDTIEYDLDREGAMNENDDNSDDYEDVDDDVDDVEDDDSDDET